MKIADLKQLSGIIESEEKKKEEDSNLVVPIDITYHVTKQERSAYDALLKYAPTIEIYDNHITKLHITNKNLESIPEEIGRLTYLNNLDLSYNKISRIEHLENIKSLGQVHLDNNQIAKIEGIDKHKYMFILSLNHNKIEKIEGLDKLTNVSMLNLSYNKISRIEGLDDLKRLDWLHLNNNLISRIEGISHLSELVNLDVSYNKISAIEGLDKLWMRKLNFSGNLIDINNPDIKTAISALEQRGVHVNIADLFPKVPK